MNLVTKIVSVKIGQLRYLNGPFKMGKLRIGQLWFVCCTRLRIRDLSICSWVELISSTIQFTNKALWTFKVLQLIISFFQKFQKIAEELSWRVKSKGWKAWSSFSLLASVSTVLVFVDIFLVLYQKIELFRCQEKDYFPVLIQSRENTVLKGSKHWSKGLLLKNERVFLK